ncbi:hypothetical protein Y900_023465 [Mycolicibacterium aromaticivorans JS19b1 = JCM 16368]|uniref:Uncharacterized protein n=1 Tax=Mycolicibacterium aromaticivorans JS19b1 = JCM 16368 TaxID=1440774 RepID=A0A064CNB5_9MYCO|nr:hypothetical protein Y900_023465 [Mycolicibacterium aromaticivorans JS19b1 = JCM 16368]
MSPAAGTARARRHRRPVRVSAGRRVAADRSRAAWRIASGVVSTSDRQRLEYGVAASAAPFLFAWTPLRQFALRDIDTRDVDPPSE